MALKSWSNTGEVIYGNDLNGNFNGLAAGTEIASGSITAAKVAAEAWTTFTPSPAGFTGAVTINNAKYIQRGKDVHVHLSFTGTSNATTKTCTLPVAAKQNARYLIRATDNTSTIAVGVMDMSAGSTTAGFYSTVGSAAWTASGTCLIEINFTYEAN